MQVFGCTSEAFGIRYILLMMPCRPFGLGPRQCPARNFAVYEARTLAAMLLREWEWELPKDSAHNDHLKNGFSGFVLNLPKDMYIDFKKKLGSDLKI